jgi:hypothetical protein
MRHVRKPVFIALARASALPASTSCGSANIARQGTLPIEVNLRSPNVTSSDAVSGRAGDAALGSVATCAADDDAPAPPQQAHLKL